MGEAPSNHCHLARLRLKGDPVRFVCATCEADVGIRYRRRDGRIWWLDGISYEIKVEFLGERRTADGVTVDARPVFVMTEVEV